MKNQFPGATGFLLFVFLFFTSSGAFAQSWIQNFSGFTIKDVEETHEGGFIILAQDHRFSDDSLTLIKTSETGEIQWQKPARFNPYGKYNIFVDAAQNYVITSNNPQASRSVVKISSTGKELAAVDDFAKNYVYWGLESSDGNYYFLSESLVYNNNVVSWYLDLHKTTPGLEVTHTTKITLPELTDSKYYMSHFRATELADGSILAFCNVMQYVNNQEQKSIFLSRTDKNGVVLFKELIITGGTIYEVRDQKDGTFLLSGQVPNPGEATNTVFLNKRTYDNVEVWTRRETTPGVNGYTSMVPASGNQLAVYGTNGAEFNYFRILDNEGMVVNEYSTAGIPGISKNHQVNLVKRTSDGGFVVFDVVGHAKFGDSRLYKMDSQFGLNTSLISGKVFNDLNKNCVKDTEDSLAVSSFIEISPGNIFTRPDAEGNFSVAVNPGTYTVKQILTEEAAFNAKPLCPADGIVEVTLSPSATDTARLNFANEVSMCHALKVSVSSTRRRRCFPGKTFLSYENTGFASATDVEFFVEFPEYLVPISMPEGWEPVNASVYRFRIAEVKAGGNQRFAIPDSVVCGNESIRGLTQCVKAWITPAANCIPESPEWDKSSIRVAGKCVQNENLRFVLHNSGDGDMEIPQDYRFFRNDTLVHTKKFQLASGDSLVLSIPATGSTIRLEADQHAHHPGKSKPRVTVEACGSENGQNPFAGMANNAPQDEEDLNMAFNCLPIVDSYDPNDKAAIPAGITANHYVKPGTRLFYTIRFQNTGTDTAYTVVLKDTLSQHLDYSTFAMHSGSHDYKLEVSGTGQPVLTFRFNRINLPDSTTDEPGSNGFIKFSIKPYEDTPLNTRIENKAYIFFDYNSAIITNTTLSTVSNYTLLYEGVQPFIPKEEYHPDIPELPVPEVTKICEGVVNGVELHAPEGYNFYEWSNGLTGKNLAVSHAGEYAVRVGKTAGIWSAFSVPVAISAYEVPEVPEIIAPQGSTVCVGDKITLSAPENFSQYEWSNGSTEKDITVEAGGEYTVRVALRSGCWSQWAKPLQTQFFEVPEAPLLTMTGSYTICQGEEVVVSAPEGFAYYQWSNGETTKELKVNTAGEYHVQVANKKDCWSNPSERLSVNYMEKTSMKKTYLPPVMDVCQHQYFTLSAPEGFTGYEWSNGSTSKSIEVKRSGKYSFRLKEGSNCWSDFNEGVQVNFHSYPEAVITQSGTTLTASEGEEYQWLLNRQELPNTSRNIEVLDGGIYQVKVTNEYGCTTFSEGHSITISGIKENLAGIKIYPNPTRGHFKVSSDLKIIRVQLFNTNGVSMLDKKTDSMEFECDLGSFPVAIYYLHLTINDRVVHYKIVKY